MSISFYTSSVNVESKTTDKSFLFCIYQRAFAFCLSYSIRIVDTYYGWKSCLNIIHFAHCCCYLILYAARLGFSVPLTVASDSRKDQNKQMHLLWPNAEVTQHTVATAVDLLISLTCWLLDVFFSTYSMVNYCLFWYCSRIHKVYEHAAQTVILHVWEDTIIYLLARSISHHPYIQHCWIGYGAHLLLV